MEDIDRANELREREEQKYFDDHVNCVDWHVPDRDKEIINKDGSWNDKPEE